MKRVFGYIEVVFDFTYLIFSSIISIVLLLNNKINILSGIMGLVLVSGDSFHLVPRIKTIITRDEEKYRWWLGIGKFITSITMTIFYILLWHIGLSFFSITNLEIPTIIIYILALWRIAICFFPQNEWVKRFPSVKWGIIRNIPFVLMGIMVSWLFFIIRLESFTFVWIFIILSFCFYIPVVLFANKNSKIGMFMLPKTITYCLILIQMLSL